MFFFRSDLSSEIPRKPPHESCLSLHPTAMVSFKRVELSEPELAEDSVQIKRSTMKKAALAVTTATRRIRWGP